MKRRDKQSRRGRKPLLDEASAAKSARLACGGTRTSAARYVGCSLDTIARAADRDPAFAAKIVQAEFNKRDLCSPKTNHLTASLAKLICDTLSGAAK